MTIKEAMSLMRSFEDHDDLECLCGDGVWRELRYELWSEQDLVRAVAMGEIRHNKRDNKGE